MTKREKQIVLDAINEYQKAVRYYHETKNWEDYKVANEGLRALRELAENLGVSSPQERKSMTFCELHKPSGCPECPNRHVCKNSTLKTVNLPDEP